MTIRTDFNPRTPCGVRLDAVNGAIDRADFNPRTPCGVRLPLSWGRMWSMPFQSTHPLRGATYVLHDTPKFAYHFNPRTPCGVRLNNKRLGTAFEHFNPRPPFGVAPLAGCDGRFQYIARRAMGFQSTHPLRGATRDGGTDNQVRAISIHAPLAGCDLCGVVDTVLRQNFNPRTPCGVRQVVPGRDADDHGISIHAPLAGCDENRRSALVGH